LNLIRINQCFGILVILKGFIIIFFDIRSDLGPEVGYEAVGLVDSSLTTVGVWARAHSIESPQGTELDTSDIRVQTIGQTSISTAEPKFSQFPQFSQFSQLNSEGGPAEIESDEIKTEISTSAEISPSYGKGVVFYLKERQIVGILLFNLFNRVNLAKEILKEKRSVDEISKCVRLFNVEEIV
jgi:apoptosis-inducing factor 1